MEKLKYYIEFGSEYDQATRQFIADSLQHRLSPASHPPPAGTPEQLRIAQSLLDPLLRDQHLPDTLRQNPELRSEVIEQVTTWLDSGQIRAKIEGDGAFEQEVQLLEEAKKKTPTQFQQGYSPLSLQLRQNYTAEEVNFPFYDQQFARFTEKGKNSSAAKVRTTSNIRNKKEPKTKQTHQTKSPPQFDTKTRKKLRKAWDLLQRFDSMEIISLSKIKELAFKQAGQFGLDDNMVYLLLHEFEARKNAGTDTSAPPEFAQPSATGKTQQKAPPKASPKAPPKPKPPRQLSAADLQRNFIRDWETALEARRLKAQLDAIDQARKEFLKRLYAEIAEYLKLQELIGPFTGYFGRGVDLSQGRWGQSGFDLLKRYAELLQNDSSIKELADLLGRMRASEVELEEEEYEHITLETHWKVDRAFQEEIVGVRESNDLNRLLPSEAGLLAEVDTELRFYQKYAESRLQTYELQGRSAKEVEARETRTRQKAKENQKGPIIICVDTSGSMQGTPEQVAKVLSFAITRLALQEKRDAYLISFSTGIETRDLTQMERSLDSLIAFLKMSFHGGTDAAPALREAVRKLDSEKWEKADVLMVSDFVMAAPPKAVQKQMAAAKEKGTRFFALTVSTSGNDQAIQSFDHCWTYDPSDRGALKRSLAQVREHLLGVEA